MGFFFCFLSPAYDIDGNALIGTQDFDQSSFMRVRCARGFWIWMGVLWWICCRGGWDRFPFLRSSHFKLVFFVFWWGFYLT